MNTYNFLIIYIITLDIATWHNLWRVNPVCPVAPADGTGVQNKIKK